MSGEELEIQAAVACGDHVILSYDYCGQCPQCNNHQPSYRNDHGSLGREHGMQRLEEYVETTWKGKLPRRNGNA